MGRKNLKNGLNLIVDELVKRGVTLQQARQEFERQFIRASLVENGGNLCRSARSLGVHRNTLRNKVSNLGIEMPERGQRSASSPRPESPKT